MVKLIMSSEGVDREKVKEAYSSLKNYAAVGRMFNISRQRVHQIINDYKNLGKEGRLKKYKKAGFFKKKCEICKKADPEVLHHKDFDNRNDKIDNLQPICRECHRILHPPKGMSKGKSMVVYKSCIICNKSFEEVERYLKDKMLLGCCVKCAQTLFY